MLQCGVWTKEDPPPGTKVIPLKWVYKVKKNPDGTIARYKGRLVAQGFYQVFGEDYIQTYSPVAKFTSIRTVLALSAQLGLKVRQMDVDTAFLNADISENIWVRWSVQTAEVTVWAEAGSTRMEPHGQRFPNQERV